MKYFVICIALLVLSSCQNIKRNVDSIRPSLNEILLEAESLAGSPKDFGQRSLFFHSLYLDSNTNFSFSLSVSHLTLAIERSLDFGRIKNLPVLKKQFSKYKSDMQNLNKDMFIKTYFAYHATKHHLTS